MVQYLEPHLRKLLYLVKNMHLVDITDDNELPIKLTEQSNQLEC